MGDNEAREWKPKEPINGKMTSPRPWKLGGFSGRMVKDSEGRDVADVDLLVNATLIVDAVNVVHPPAEWERERELRETLELAMRTLRQHCVCKFEDLAKGRISEVLAQCRAALERKA